MTELTLAGLDGANPLGFLAALGVLGVVDGTEHAGLRWVHEGGWRPVLMSSHAVINDLVEQLDADRQLCLDDPALALEYGGKRDLKPAPAGFRSYLEQLVATASMTNRRSVDWASAFATDVAVDNNGNTKPTALHFTAGQQQFLDMVRQLLYGVTTDDLREAVAGPWTYSRALPVMGWDATVARDYALRATDPSTDKKCGVPGADWLAVRGLAFIQTVPVGTRVRTTGCTGGWKDGRLRWPLWGGCLRVAEVHSLLGQDSEAMPTAVRRARGIEAVLSSGIKRSDQGGYGSFEPSAPV